MPKTSSINSRIDPELKKNAEAVFHKVGLSTSQAITLFYTQVTLIQGLPFSVRTPNKATKDAIKAVEKGNVTTYHNLDRLKDEWEVL